MNSPDENAATATQTDRPAGASPLGAYEIPEFIKRWDGLRKRVMSAVIVATLVLFAVTAGGVWFYALMVLTAVQMVREWDVITAHEAWPGWKVSGFAYVGIPCIALLWLRGITLTAEPNAGMRLALYLIFIIVATDTGAYFAGKRIGGPKLAPAISPGKTWAGLAGGVLAAAATGAVCASFTPYPMTFAGCIWTGAFLALVAQGGDLFESWLKRRAGLKDSGVLIPGHGGILDRVDGVVAAAPVFALMVALSGLAG